mmetsp:Transcript_3536/g.9420  ORF Transcript_3536/g.9420 Transcript_3536/m.9420 type:complete len:247 (-) Transcript_3536:996-1736(-)
MRAHTAQAPTRHRTGATQAPTRRRTVATQEWSDSSWRFDAGRFGVALGVGIASAPAEEPPRVGGRRVARGVHTTLPRASNVVADVGAVVLSDLLIGELLRAHHLQPRQEVEEISAEREAEADEADGRRGVAEAERGEDDDGNLCEEGGAEHVGCRDGLSELQSHVVVQRREEGGAQRVDDLVAADVWDRLVAEEPQLVREDEDHREAEADGIVQEDHRLEREHRRVLRVRQQVALEQALPHHHQHR